MSDEQSHVCLEAAKRCVNEAKALEEADCPERAEKLWQDAEEHYADAGIDPDWFDDAKLTGAMSETNRPLLRFEIQNTSKVELTYRGLHAPITGVIAEESDLVDVTR